MRTLKFISCNWFGFANADVIFFTFTLDALVSTCRKSFEKACSSVVPLCSYQPGALLSIERRDFGWFASHRVYTVQLSTVHCSTVTECCTREKLEHPLGEKQMSVRRPIRDQPLRYRPIWFVLPGFCTGAKDDTMRSLSEGEQGRALLPPTLRLAADAAGAKINDNWDEMTFEGRETWSKVEESPALASGGRGPVKWKCSLG